MTLTIRPAVEGDLGKAKALLIAVGLPVEDLVVGRLALVAEKGKSLQGVIGIEVYGSVALLRSLAVSPDAPDAIRSTEEFSGLYPGDAVLMSKSLP